MSASPLDRSAGREAGEARKADAHDQLETHREAYIRRGRRALLSALLDRTTATMDDVRSVVTLPRKLDPKLFGVVPGPLAKAGMIRADGFVKTCRPTAHARPLTRWSLADRGAAERWLVENPDLPEPDGETPADDAPGLASPHNPHNGPGAAAVTAAPGF